MSLVLNRDCQDIISLAFFVVVEKGVCGSSYNKVLGMCLEPLTLEVSIIDVRLMAICQRY